METMDFMDSDPEMPLPTTEINAIPLNCWHNVKKLADIWIPSLLLPNRNRPSNMRAPQGIYHTLEKRDSSKYSKSFSVYSHTDNDDEFDEIYVSDSEDNNFSSYSSGFEKVESCDNDNTLPVIADSVRPDSIASSNDLGKITENNVSKKNYEATNGFEDVFKELNTLNKHTSLEDILDNNAEINIKNFEFCFKKEDEELLSLYGTKEKKLKKNKKDKVKKKTSKYVKIDNFFETDTDANTHAQEYYCDKYFQELLNEKPKNKHSSSVPVEFPDLTFHSDKTTKENDVPVFSNLRTIFNTKSGEINKNENIVDDVQEIGQSPTDPSPGKIVIENIPADVTKDEVLSLLYGYGEIKEFSLVSAGNFFMAYVEVDLNCDIDWIVECLNGSEPFGAYNTKLRCYKA